MLKFEKKIRRQKVKAYFLSFVADTVEEQWDGSSVTSELYRIKIKNSLVFKRHPCTAWLKKYGLISLSLYGLNRKRRLNTRQTVGCGIPSFLLALRVDLRGVRSELSWIRLTFSSDTRSRPELLPLHRQPICSNWWFQRQMLFLVGGWMLKRRRNARCTAVAVSVLMNSRTQKILCCIVAILLSTDAAARLYARRAL